MLKYIMILLITLLILWTGCNHQIVKHPDSPMLITESGWRGIRVAIYSKAENKLIDYGWVKAPIGKTIIEYDWEKYINTHQVN